MTFKLTSNYNLSAARVRMYNPALFANKGQKNRVKKQYLMSVNCDTCIGSCIHSCQYGCAKFQPYTDDTCCVSCN